MKSKLVMIGVLAGSVSMGGLVGCASTDNQNTARGAAIGAVAGAIAGKATANRSNKRMVIGAAVGALAGAAVGSYMDNQEKALREELSGTGVQVHREGDNLRLEIPSQLTFAINRADIQPQLYPVLNDIARVLSNYDKTMLIISGHTDDTGPYDFNMRLSLQRAESVSSYLAAQGVLPIRMETQGFGPTYPMVPNTSEANRALNRRVEIHIEPVTEG
ncbi:OmpA family protein [Alkalimonas delamerensis]|uniref:OmpA family protein n=1 Tax=Alkalimonas delamerensis TaxID=265981 RepID=A0ABT9GT21_9GAMM|nr:OmpA family protein [Alkalimonas delamerensis]MDP4530121.1 OmpA family protein [Alkalimonas delamerensis]